MKLQDFLHTATTHTLDQIAADHELATQIQIRLVALGLLDPPVDGLFGPKSKAAFSLFLSHAGIPTPVILNDASAKALIEMKSPIPYHQGSAIAAERVLSPIPEQAIQLIKQFEGLNLQVYPDPLSGGKPYTVGWGCTQKIDGSEWHLGESITLEEAEYLLRHQLERDYLPPLQKIPVWSKLNDNQQSALISFAWNLGAGFYGSSGFGSMTRMLNNQEWSASNEVFGLYCNPGSNVEEGLRRRRKAEAQLFNKPV